MSERRWTPGPWRYRYTEPRPWNPEPRPDRLVDANGESIRFADVTLSSGEEAVANTHLIAAAPDMYDSAEEVEGILKFIFEDGALSEDIVNGLAIDPHGVLRDLRAALLRAKGEQG